VLKFRSGFEDNTYIDRSSHRVFNSIGLLGEDLTTGYDWTLIDQGTVPYLTDFYLYDEGANSQAIIDGSFIGRPGNVLALPVAPGSKRSEATAIFDHPALSDFPREKEYNPENPNMKLDFTIKYKLYIHEDYNKLKDYSGSIAWWQVFEYKSWPWIDNYWRGNVNINKESGSDQLYWNFHTEFTDLTAEPSLFSWETYLKNGTVLTGYLNGVKNKDVPVPIGEWFDLEIYFKEGGIDDGRFIMHVNGQEVFDLEVATADPYPARSQANIRNIFFFKHYIKPSYTTYVNGESTYYIDDFEYWEGNAITN
jgi:hypothetical protein